MKYIISILFIVNIFAFAKDEVVGKLYFSRFMGHIHKIPADLSASVTTIQCAQALKVLKETEPKEGWLLVNIGEDKGYVRSKHLNTKRPSCFQERYPRFYQKQNFDMTELYFWGRLVDHFIEGESKSI